MPTFGSSRRLFEYVDRVVVLVVHRRMPVRVCFLKMVRDTWMLWGGWSSIVLNVQVEASSVKAPHDSKG